ncbi:hypothetical protein DASC09_024720 [Saccharomycopsis crataegensis]|uniref:Uncharacterized protein n=1 Tax=Saccharomycopsis crataegensis TaxID=43959 RepID=A0AAV5QKJ5_9ASCO|nr:hypothetical protein DASC09_024720 [Saccharomycopsis crataegensis]
MYESNIATNFEKCTFRFSKFGYLQNIRQLYIKTSILRLDENFSLLKLTDLEIEYTKILTLPNGEAFNSEQFPSLEKLKLVPTKVSDEIPLIIDLKTLKMKECSYNNGHSNIRIIHPESISSFKGTC